MQGLLDRIIRASENDKSIGNAGREGRAITFRSEG